MSGGGDPVLVPPNERRTERAKSLARRSLISVGEDIRLARLRAGMPLRELGQAAAFSPAFLSRIERALVPHVVYETLARIGSVVGLDVSVRAFPNGQVLRDAAQLELLQRLRRLLGPGLRLRVEVPLGLPGDLRAWDAVIDAPGRRVVVELETRLRDVQALVRRINLKLRDGHETRLTLVVADTRTNRHVVRASADDVAELGPLKSRVVAASLRAGYLPPGSGILFL